MSLLNQLSDSELYQRMERSRNYQERAKNSIISLPMHIIAEAHGQYVEELRKRGLINNQLEYKMLGNGWNSKTIMHILQYLK